MSKNIRTGMSKNKTSGMSKKHRPSASTIYADHRHRPLASTNPEPTVHLQGPSTPPVLFTIPAILQSWYLSVCTIPALTSPEPTAHLRAHSTPPVICTIPAIYNAGTCQYVQSQHSPVPSRRRISEPTPPHQ